MKTFLLHWMDGKIETVVGPDLASAMNNAGIGMGALPALDYWEEVTGPSGAAEEKKLFAVCRCIKRGKKSIPVFYAICSMMDIAQRHVDKLTKKFGPTFIIIDAPLDP